MKVLIGCEESQAVCKAFRERDIEAYSCDIQECSGEYIHLQMPFWMTEAIDLKKWDLIIMHPPCTCISVSGNATYALGMLKHDCRIQAVKWTQKLWDYATSKCNYVAMENPVGCLNTLGLFPKPQYIQPYQFGHPETKKTGLWLFNLPNLKPTTVVDPIFIIGKKDGKKYSPIHYMSVGKDKLERGKLRSKTYPCIARAMAEQWTPIITNLY